MTLWASVCADQFWWLDCHHRDNNMYCWCLRDVHPHQDSFLADSRDWQDSQLSLSLKSGREEILLDSLTPKSGWGLNFDPPSLYLIIVMVVSVCTSLFMCALVSHKKIARKTTKLRRRRWKRESKDLQKRKKKLQDNIRKKKRRKIRETRGKPGLEEEEKPASGAADGR